MENGKQRALSHADQHVRRAGGLSASTGTEQCRGLISPGQQESSRSSSSRIAATLIAFEQSVMNCATGRRAQPSCFWERLKLALTHSTRAASPMTVAAVQRQPKSTQTAQSAPTAVPRWSFERHGAARTLDATFGAARSTPHVGEPFPSSQLRTRAHPQRRSRRQARGWHNSPPDRAPSTCRQPFCRSARCQSGPSG